LYKYIKAQAKTDILKLVIWQFE